MNTNSPPPPRLKIKMFFKIMIAWKVSVEVIMFVICTIYRWTYDQNSLCWCKIITWLIYHDLYAHDSVVDEKLIWRTLSWIKTHDCVDEADLRMLRMMKRELWYWGWALLIKGHSSAWCTVIKVFSDLEIYLAIGSSKF